MTQHESLAQQKIIATAQSIAAERDWPEYVLNECKQMAKGVGAYNPEEPGRINVRFGLLPKEVQADKIYLGKDNRKYIKEKHIDCFNHPLGRPPKEENDLRLQDRKRAVGQRNEIEATFGTSKRVYRANDIRAKLDETADMWIGACFFAKNVMKFLRGLLRLISEILAQMTIIGLLYNKEGYFVPVFACHKQWSGK